jgi:uncharacterized protein with NRDE domain
MCTAIIYRSKKTNIDFPIRIACTRDENLTRSWLPPNRHWQQYKYIIAGLDVLSNGTWMGLNEYGIFSFCLNQEHTLLTYGNLYDKNKLITTMDSQKISRGKLVLDILTHYSLPEILKFLQQVDLQKYRKFYLIFGNYKNMYFCHNDDNKKDLICSEIPYGINMVTPYGLNEIEKCPRTNNFLEKFHEATLPNPSENNWQDWLKLLATRTEWGAKDRSNIYNGISIIPDKQHNFGTISSAFIALDANSKKNVFCFAHGLPGEKKYQRVNANGNNGVGL